MSEEAESLSSSGQQEDSMLGAEKWSCSSGIGERFVAVRSDYVVVVCLNSEVITCPDKDSACEVVMNMS